MRRIGDVRVPGRRPVPNPYRNLRSPDELESAELESADRELRGRYPSELRPYRVQPKRRAGGSPDGSRLVFGVSGKLWRMDADGSNLEPLGVSVFDAEPRFSPDGASIVFLRGDFAKGISEPWMRDLATGAERSLIADNHRELEQADWSPDGRWIIYNTLTDATGAHVEQIERMPVVDSKAIPAVVYARADDFAFKPAYSPDGASILFGCHESVCLMNADGSNVSVLVSVPDAHLNHFAWGVSIAH